MENIKETTPSSNALKQYASMYNRDEFLTLNEEMSFGEYIELLKKKPKLARNAFQYVYDTIMSKGTETFTRHRRKHTRYNFFSDSDYPIFGLLLCN